MTTNDPRYTFVERHGELIATALGVASWAFGFVVLIVAAVNQ